MDNLSLHQIGNKKQGKNIEHEYKNIIIKCNYIFFLKTTINLILKDVKEKYCM